MAGFLKVFVSNQVNPNATEVFAIKPIFRKFHSFKYEIFIRMPLLKNQPLKFYYQGKFVHFVDVFFFVSK